MPSAEHYPAVDPDPSSGDPPPDAFEPPGRFAIIRLGPDQNVPADAIAHGDLAAVFEWSRLNEVRASALGAIAKADAVRLELADREQQVLAQRLGAVHDTLDRMNRRFDIIEAHVAEQREADVAAEAARTQALVDAWPDIDEPATWAPGGELHVLEPTDPDDPEADPVDDQGGLPRSLSLPSARGSLVPRAELAHPRQAPHPQPVAVSLGGDTGAATLAGAEPPGRVGY